MILVLLQRKGSVTSSKVRPSLLYFLLLWKQEEPETFGKSLSFYDKSCVISRAGFMPSPTWKHRRRWWELRLWFSFRISPRPLPVALALPKELGAGFGTAHHCGLITCQLPISEWWLLCASVSPPVTQRSLCLFLVDLEAGMFFCVEAQGLRRCREQSNCNSLFSWLRCDSPFIHLQNLHCLGCYTFVSTLLPYIGVAHLTTAKWKVCPALWLEVMPWDAGCWGLVLHGVRASIHTPNLPRKAGKAVSFMISSKRRYLDSH